MRPSGGHLSSIAVFLLLPAASAFGAAPSDCLDSARTVRTELRSFAADTRSLGSAFSIDDGLASAIDAFDRKIASLKDAERESFAWKRSHEAEDLQSHLMRLEGAIRVWREGASNYRACVASSSCSIGDLIKREESSSRAVAAWLRAISEEGLDRATGKIDAALTNLDSFGARVKDPVATARACLAQPAPVPTPSPRSEVTPAVSRTSATPPPSSARPAPAPTPTPIPEPSPAAAAAGPLSISHQEVSCVVAEKFPRLDALFSPADRVAVARVVFQGANTQEWYSVAMKAEGPLFFGVLPKPKKTLALFRYYVEVTDKNLGTSRTPEFETRVVSSAADCKGRLVAGSVGAASIVLLGPAGAAAIPIGFAPAGIIAGASTTAAGATGIAGGGGGGLSGAAIAGIAGGAVAAGAVAAKGGGSGGSGTSGSSPDVQLAPPPTPTPTPTPTPAPAPTPTPTPGVSQYNGNYRGTYSGVFAGGPASGPVAFTISNGQLSLSEPGTGGGTIASNGSTNFSGKVDIGIAVDCGFNGSIQGANAGGQWSCSGSGLSGSGTWNAQKQ